MIRSTRSAFFTALVVGAGAAVSASPINAQQPDGFLFQRPIGSVGVHFGYSVPGAGSEIFDFVNQNLTVDRGDFRTTLFGGHFAVSASDHVDVELGISYSESRTASEFRDWVDGDDLPIEQVTSFKQAPITLSAKWYLQDRGQSVGNLAWVPASWAPYIGAGAGVVWYEFSQDGDFVDFETLDIFRDLLLSEGTSFTAHGLVGADFSLTPRVVLMGEGRYQWGRADMSQDFVDFDAMDLSGFRATAGFRLRF